MLSDLNLLVNFFISESLGGLIEHYSINDWCPYYKFIIFKYKLWNCRSYI